MCMDCTSYWNFLPGNPGSKGGCSSSKGSDLTFWINETNCESIFVSSGACVFGAMDGHNRVSSNCGFFCDLLL